MLEFQHIPIKMSGIDTKTDDKDSVPGSFVTSENVYILKTGKIQNRHGFKFPNNPITHSSEVIAAVANGNGQLALERDGTFYFEENFGSVTVIKSEYSTPTIELETFIPKASVQVPVYMSNTGTAFDIVASSMSCGIAYGVYSYSIRTSAIGSNVGEYVTTASVFNNDSKTIIESVSIQVTLPTAAFLDPICVDDKYIVSQNSDTALQISYINPDGSNPNTILPTNTGNVTRFECCRGTEHIYVIEARASSTKLILNNYNKTTRNSITSTVSSSYAYTKLAIACNAAETELYIAAYRGTTLDVFVITNDALYTYSLGATFTSLLQVTLSEDLSDTTKIVGVLDFVGSSEIIRFTKTTGASLVQTVLYNYRLVSTINYPYVVFYNNDNTLNSAYILYNLQYLITLCSMYYGEVLQYYDVFASNYRFCLTRFNGNYLPLQILNNINAATPTQGRLFSIVYKTSKINTTTNIPYMVNWNGTIITNAWGNLRLLDTINIPSLPLYVSFPFAAPAPSVSDSATVGNLTALGVYTYLAIYSYVDSNNNIIYSSPLYFTTHTLAGGISSTQVTVPVVNDTLFKIASIALYRTEASGSIFYFLTSFMDIVGANYTFSDGVSDASLILNKVLYTTGDIIDSAPSPTVKYMTIAKSRLWIISPENNDQLYYSKKLYPKELPQFNAVYTLLVQNVGGDLQAVAEMDDKIIIFRKNAVFVTYGDGVDEIGNGSFAEPQLITMSLGCKYPRSIVLNDKGLFFMSYEGIYMITRGLTIEYVGAAVENYNSLTITQALNLVDRHQLWFMSAEGTTLVHDDYFGTWHTFTNQATYAAFILNDDTPAYYRALAASKYPGRLMIEDSTKYYDGAADNPIGITLESGWISLTGIQGFQRMRTFTFVGNLNDTLSLKLYNDFETSENETFSIVPATVGTSPAQYQVMPARQRTQSVKYKITLASLSGAFDISGLGIEAGIKRGTIRYDRSKRISS